MTDRGTAVRQRFCACAIILCIIFGLCGCASFARKFTRKPKKDLAPSEPMVLTPEVYPARDVDKDAAYSGYFTYWKSWHDELIGELAGEQPSMRRRLDCIRQAIRNLEEMRGLLSGEKKAEAGEYLSLMNALQADLERDLYGNNMWSIRRQAEDLRRRINRSLQYDRVKDELQ